MPVGVIDAIGFKQVRGVTPDLSKLVKRWAAKTEIGEEFRRREATVRAGNKVFGFEFLNLFILCRGGERFTPAVAGIDLKLKISEVKSISGKRFRQHRVKRKRERN